MKIVTIANAIEMGRVKNGAMEPSDIASLNSQIAQCKFRIDQLGKATGEYDQLARKV